ncbi:MAG: hypothetical protein WBV82_21040 [Myxococcaceae bacterium]
MARVQEKFQRRLATQARSKRERFIDCMQQAIKSQGIDHNPLSRDDLAQMMEGFVSVISEALQGRSTEVRTFYVETVVPGLIRKGIPMDSLVPTIKAWTEGVQEVLRDELKEAPDRSGAMQWMSSFFKDYMSDVERATRTKDDPPKGPAFFDSVVAASCLSPLIAASVVSRACDMSGIQPQRMAPEQLRDVLPALRKGMSIFLSNPEIDRALRRLEALAPRIMEDAVSP